MHDEPRKNLKWLEQELLAEDSVHRDFSKLPDQSYHKDEELLEIVDMLIRDEEPEEEIPVRNAANHYGRISRGERAVRAQTAKQMDEAAYMPVKTKKQLRQEEKQRKIAEKKANINRNIKGLVLLAILECIGIWIILGWWLQ